MASNYPTSVDNFVDRQDGIDIIQAADINDAYAGIEATETFIGHSNAGQSHNTDIMTFLKDGIFGCGIKFSSTTAVIVQAGQIAIQNSGLTTKKIRHKSTDTTLTNADLDTGASFTNSTAHWIYATADSAVTTPVYKISTNASTPTGFTNYRRIGGFYVDGSGNIIFVWSDSRPSVKPGEVIYEYKKTSSATDSTSTTIPQDNTKPQAGTEGKEITALAIVVVPTSTTDIVEVEANLILQSSTGGCTAFISKNSETDALATSRNGSSPVSLVNVKYSYVPGSVSPITFKIHFGGTSGTNYLMSDAGSALYNGTMLSEVKVTVRKAALTA